jgi:phenylacetate-coenzyme A ligase PaaK-like adenylate-forming protein
LGQILYNRLKKEIFTANESNFTDLALALFKFQYLANDTYKAFCDNLKINPIAIDKLNKIPFLPIEFFKTHTILSGKAAAKKTFTSSGTTASMVSKHHVSDLGIYEQSFLKSFEIFYGDIRKYRILALLPSYLERNGSSLVFMVNYLITLTKNNGSAFFLKNTQELFEALKNKQPKTILLGVTYALLDFADEYGKEVAENNLLQNAIVMETGGMKGKRQELIKTELHELLCCKLGASKIHSEYGMTELLSQAYSHGEGIFKCPPWMKIMVRDVNDPLHFTQNGKTGGINVIDLANINSCSFIATRDLGKILPDNSFEILGRFDNSDIRGCNLLIE